MEPTTTKSVLIVDDDSTLREMYDDYLKASGFTVFTAQDGEEALAKASETKPSAILLDLMMPKMNGIETLRHLKADANMRDIPVIVFTALIQDLEEQESYAAGASDYVVKTEVTPKAIVDKINHFTSSTPATPANPAQTTTPPPTPIAHVTNPPSVDLPPMPAPPVSAPPPPPSEPTNAPDDTPPVLPQG